jgi:hypothetical protein
MRTCVFLPGVSAEVLPGTYEHHHPDFLHDAANTPCCEATGSVVRLEDARENRQKA